LFPVADSNYRDDSRLSQHSSVQRVGKYPPIMNKQFIGVALAVAFLTLVAIIAGVGYLGLSAMDNLRADEQSISETEWRDVELASQALAFSNRNAHINMEMVVVEDPAVIESLIAQRKENSAQITAILEKLKTRIGSEKEQQLLNTVLQDRETYLTSYQHATDLLVNERDREAARKWLIQDTSPLLIQYGEAWSEYSHFQSEEMNQRLQESAALYAAGRRKVLYLLIASVILALVIAASVGRGIMVEIRRREAAEQHTQRLNEQLEVKVRDRTAALEISYRDLVVQIAERKAAEERLREKNAFLEAQANSTADGILVVDNEGRRILQNRRFREISRIPQAILDDAGDQSALDYVAKRLPDPEGFLRKVRHLNEHKQEICRDELGFLDGTILDRYSAPVLGDDGKYYGRIWVLRDITERRRSEEVVRRLSTAVEQSPMLVVITDLRGSIVYVNRKFVECTGYTVDEVIGKNPRILKSGHTSGEDYKQLWGAITRGNEWRGEFHNRRKNGELYWESALITPIRDEKGAISHFLAIKEDITDRRTLEAQLHRAQKLEAIGQLAAGIAHEINTPMQFIGDNTRFAREAWAVLDKLIALLCSLHDRAIDQTGFQESLKKFDFDDLRDLQQELPAAIEQSLDGVARVSKIVQAMKEFSHPGTEEKQPADINHAIETTVTVARNEWKYVADVDTVLSPDLGLVPCHIGELNQVILNLLVNSAHAITAANGNGTNKKGKITIRTIREKDAVQISIQDTGCGIPPEVRPRIFEPFFTTKDVGKGTGQGLMLAHAVIVKKHEGNIWFESEVGKGTTFFIRLPA
jgi:PAS domain S-box-containing protein